MSTEVFGPACRCGTSYTPLQFLGLPLLADRRNEEELVNEQTRRCHKCAQPFAAAVPRVLVALAAAIELVATGDYEGAQDYLGEFLIGGTRAGAQ